MRRVCCVRNVEEKGLMKRASLATTLAASLLFGPVPAAMAVDDARATEARATEARATEARATEARATEARATEAGATEARAAEERLLGDEREQARFLASQPFTREIG